jgi:diadenylate cyclase
MTWLRWQSMVDFAILSATFYFVLLWAKDTRALRVVLGIIGIHAAARVSRYFDLSITAWVLDGLSLVLLLLLLVVFQSEFRHALMRLDGMLRLGLYPLDAHKSGYRSVAEAAFAMASERVGALIALGRKDSVRELVSNGISLGADISAEILMAVFRKDSPIHDGAVIVEAGRIAKAGVVLPLTQRSDVPPEFGTRHRAAMGLAERCDALVIVVSEERGEVTLMQGRRIIPAGSLDALLQTLEGFQIGRKVSFAVRVRGILFANLRLKLAALGLAGIIWGATFVAVLTTVRTVSIPVEFANVPAGMAIVGQSATRLEVQLRGSPWVMDSATLTGLVAHIDLRKTEPGWQSIPVSANALDLPPGVVVDQVDPQTVNVRIVRQTRP